MHELSIAYSLVETANAAAQKAGARKVTLVRLRLGLLSGIVKDSLLFGYDIATRGTLLEGSQLEITELPVVVHCNSCGRDVELPSTQSFRCPICNTPSAQVLQGKEIEIDSLEVEMDDAKTEPAPATETKP